MTEDVPQRDQSLREVFNGLRGLVRAGVVWRLMPHDLPPWHPVYQQSQRRCKAGVFDAMVHDLRALWRLATGRTALRWPSATVARCNTTGNRYRHGETLSTAWVESTVHQVVSRRMVKRQAIQWTQRSAHLMLQVRTQALHDDLRSAFGRWHPGMQTKGRQEPKAA